MAANILQRLKIRTLRANVTKGFFFVLAAVSVAYAPRCYWNYQYVQLQALSSGAHSRLMNSAIVHKNPIFSLKMLLTSY